jgi:amino acid adenylation domain-containing protein
VEYRRLLNQLLQHYVTEQAAVRPEATAVVMGPERLTYGELELKSNQVASALTQVGCQVGDRVCLLAAKAPTTIVAMLATLKAGALYVPIDLASPPARIARIMTAADPVVALVLGSEGSKMLAGLRELGVVRSDVVIGAMDEVAARDLSPAATFDARGKQGLNDETPTASLNSDSPAHLLFTSGSTGVPKGVIITHANVQAFVEWAVCYFGMRPGDRISGHPPLHFDLSTFDIYATFCAGAELHLVPPGVLLPAQLADFISGSQLTQWFAVPSALTYMADRGGLPAQGFPSLKRVLWCGEVLQARVLAQWMHAVPQATFTNLYGPTEATIASSYFRVRKVPDDDATAVPIGHAITGEELLVLDEELNEAQQGEPGELYIGGVGLSPGYWRDPERSSASFRPDPRPTHHGRRLYRTGDLARVGDDGELYFLGRVDSQIKSRGHRIELGEIEIALYACGAISECAVVGVPTTGFEGLTVCCAYVPKGDTPVAPVRLRSALRSNLPSYMLPSRWREMRNLPKNANGKIDRPRVQELFLQAP